MSNIIIEVLDKFNLGDLARRTILFWRDPSINCPEFTMNRDKAVGDMIISLTLFTILAELFTQFAPNIYDRDTISVIDNVQLGFYLFIQTIIVSGVLTITASGILAFRDFRLHSNIGYHNFRVKTLINIPFFILFSIMLAKTFDGSNDFQFELDDPRLYVGIACGTTMLIIVYRQLLKPLAGYFLNYYGKWPSRIAALSCLAVAYVINSHLVLFNTDKLIKSEEACKLMYKTQLKLGHVTEGMDSACFIGNCIKHFDEKSN